MFVKHQNEDLERLEFDANFGGGFAPKVIFDFRHRMQLLRAAPTERALLSLQALRMQPLNDGHVNYRIRVNNEYNLSVGFDGADNERTVVVREMTTYNKVTIEGAEHG